MPDVRRPEEPLGVSDNERLLHAERRCAPESEPAVIVVVVEEGDEVLLVPYEKSGRAVAQAFARLRKREAEPPDSCQDLASLGHAVSLTRRLPRSASGRPRSRHAAAPETAAARDAGPARSPARRR